MLGEVRKDVCQNKDNDSCQLKKLLDVFVKVISVFLVIFCRWMREAEVPGNIHDDELDV